MFECRTHGDARRELRREVSRSDWGREPWGGLAGHGPFRVVRSGAGGRAPAAVDPDPLPRAAH